MVGGAGRDVDDLDEARRRLIAAEPQRPARLAGEPAQRMAGLHQNGADLFESNGDLNYGASPMGKLRGGTGEACTIEVVVCPCARIFPSALSRSEISLR